MFSVALVMKQLVSFTLLSNYKILNVRSIKYSECVSVLLK